MYASICFLVEKLEILGLNSSRVVSAIKPGVMGETGIETKDIINGVIEKIKPDCLIVIDALKSGSLKRLNKTIQLTQEIKNLF